jgi:glycosyltransferase involved in cell wall biosynthesis
MILLHPEVKADAQRVVPSPPLITFVVAVFNASKTLSQCLSSVTQQTCKDFELVVVDGGSTDGSLDILQTQAGHFSYWTSEPDDGVYDAWNKALRHARGDWICFLGADDYLWNSGVVQHLSETLSKLPDQTSIAYGKIILLDRDGKPMFELGKPWDELAAQFKKKMCLPHPAVLHRRRLFDAFGGFDPAFRIAGDYEFLLRSMKGQAPHFLGDLVVTAMRPGGLSSNPANTIRGLNEAYRAQKKNGQKVLWLPRLMAWVRVYVRLLVMRIFGARATSVLLDWGRSCMGLPAYWTKV